MCDQALLSQGDTNFRPGMWTMDTCNAGAWIQREIVMKRLLILAAMALGLTTTAMSDSADAGRWRGGYGYSYGGYYPGYYRGGYYGGGYYRPYRSYYRGGYYGRPYRNYGYGGWGWGGRRGYVSTPWFGVGW